MPRFPGANVLFRTWGLEGGVLHAANGELWVNGEPTSAECDLRNHPRGQPVPSARCSCGLHGYYQPPTGLYLPTGVLGAFVAWGEVARQSDGMRVEHALPVALTRLPSMQLGVFEAARLYAEEWEIGWCESIDELVEEAERYAPLVPEDEWVTYNDPDAVRQKGIPLRPPPKIEPMRGLAPWQYDAAREPFRQAKRREARRSARRAQLQRERKLRRI